MSLLNNLLLRITRISTFLFFAIPITVKLIEFIHNLVRTVDHMRDSLKVAESHIRQLQNTVEDLKYQVEENRKIIREQTTATMDMQQQLVDQSIDAISTTKEIGDIYECLDLLDDRILEFAKYKKTGKIKKQVRDEALEIDALDHKSPNEEVFDNFIASKSDLLFDSEGRHCPVAEICKVFEEWYDAEYVNLDDRPSNHALEEYMCRNFPPLPSDYLRPL